MFDVSVVSQLSCLTGCTAQVYLEYIQRNLPEGVAMEVKKVSEFVKRHYANTVQSSPFTNYLFIRSDCHGKGSRPHSGTHVEGWTQSEAKPVTLVMIITRSHPLNIRLIFVSDYFSLHTIYKQCHVCMKQNHVFAV